MSNKLQKEIIKRIFENFGFSFENKRLVHDVIMNDVNKLNFTLPLEIDSVKVEKTIWAAELPLATIRTNIIVTELSDDEFQEFALAVQLTDMPLYGIRLSSHPDDIGNFCVMTDQSWVEVPIGVQASVLSGLEYLQNFLFNWQKAENVEKMYEQFVLFLNAGDEER